MDDRQARKFQKELNAGLVGLVLLAILEACTGEPPGQFGSYGDLKRSVTGAVEAALAPIRERHRELERDPGYVASVLAEGRARVRPIAEATVRRAKRAIGLLD